MLISSKKTKISKMDSHGLTKSREKNIFEKVCDIGNIEKAGRKAGKDKRSHTDVKVYKKNADKYNADLSSMLKNRTYSVTSNDYKIFNKVTGNGKTRKIKKLDFYPFRVAQHAVMNVVQDKWIKSLTFDSYNCIEGRGINSKK